MGPHGLDIAGLGAARTAPGVPAEYFGTPDAVRQPEVRLLPERPHLVGLGSAAAVAVPDLHQRPVGGALPGGVQALAGLRVGQGPVAVGPPLLGTGPVARPHA